MRYSKHVNETKTSQRNQAKDTQAENNAGGFSFVVDDWTRLDRFLILGTEGGSYYASERKMTRGNAKCVASLIKKDGVKVVERVVAISTQNRAPKNDPALFVLAMCAKKGDDATRKAAWAALPKVARIGTHLFNFATDMEAFGGWGRATQRAFSNWYLDKPVGRAAYQAVKYQSRNGWSHRDILRLAKPKTVSEGHNALFRWVTKGELNGSTDEGLAIVQAFEQAKTADKKTVIKLIVDHGLTREMIPTEFLSDVKVQEALLQNMPITAMIRNLGNMTRSGLLKPLSKASKLVVERLGDQERLIRGRVHPIAVLSALKVYQHWAGLRGKAMQNTWKPVGSITDALDQAFYLAFKAVEPSNKRTLLALDISGSMDGGEIAGVPGLTPRLGSSAMAVVTARVEKDHHFIAFTCNSRGGGYWYGRQDTEDALSGITEVNISKRDRLDTVMKKSNELANRMGGTDCALPMVCAEKKGIEVDTFCVYTDSETWAGSIHPFQALKNYRQRMGIPAKLVVIGMTATEFSIADPDDAGMMDVVGFDTAAPNLIADFSRQ